MTRRPRPPFADRDSLLAWLAAMDPGDHVRLARLLTDANTTRAVAAAADVVVYEMTRHNTAAAVAEQLGLTLKQVRRTVETHAARLRAAETGNADPPPE